MTRHTHPEAIIPVERIGGALLLLSADADSLWPSTAMSEQVMARLDAHGFTAPHRYIAYHDAGHGALRPPVREPARNGSYDNLGGTETGNAAARADSWRQIVDFFATYLSTKRR